MSRLGKLTKTGRTNEEENPFGFRTEFMEGEFEIVPRVGGFFSMRGESLTPGAGMFRVMETSLIKSVEELEITDDGYHHIAFETQNSLYILEYIP